VFFGASAASGHFIVRLSPASRSALVDLFVNSNATSNDMVRTQLPLLQAAFGENATTVWSINSRGVRCHPNSDKEIMLRDWSLNKTLVTEVQSDYQSIEIWERTEPAVEYRFGDGADRVLYLDDVTQVSTEDEWMYHEVAQCSPLPARPPPPT
tara:strand:+ start:219 stop:677 length:459 start_codon:yes stop_codon:yes gene_type:complete